MSLRSVVEGIAESLYDKADAFMARRTGFVPSNLLMAHPFSIGNCRDT